MKRISEDLKLDIGLVSQALNNGNAIGRYFDMSKYKKALALLNSGAMAADKTTKVEILQATDAAGSDSKAITDAEAIITANALVTEATLTCSSVQADDTVTINGTTFTAVVDGNEDYSAQTFSVGGTPTDAECAADLAACINANFDTITASADSGVVTIKASEPGETVITASADATITVATTQAQAYVEIDAADLDVANGFTHIAAKVTTTADSNVAVVLLRGDGRWNPEQKVGASAVI